MWSRGNSRDEKKNDRQLEERSKVALDAFMETKTSILGVAVDNDDPVDPRPTIESAQCHRERKREREKEGEICPSA